MVVGRSTASCCTAANLSQAPLCGSLGSSSILGEKESREKRPTEEGEWQKKNCYECL